MVVHVNPVFWNTQIVTNVIKQFVIHVILVFIYKSEENVKDVILLIKVVFNVLLLSTVLNVYQLNMHRMVSVFLVPKLILCVRNVLLSIFVLIVSIKLILLRMVSVNIVVHSIKDVCYVIRINKELSASTVLQTTITLTIITVICVLCLTCTVWHANQRDIVLLVLLTNTLSIMVFFVKNVHLLFKIVNSVQMVVAVQNVWITVLLIMKTNVNFVQLYFNTV